MRSTLVQAPGRRRRVLLVEGAPGFEHSFLKRALSRDPGVEVDSVVRKGRNDRGRDTFYIQASGSRSAALADGFPNGRAHLFVYDAVALANLDGDSLAAPQLALAEAFVSVRGGGLLVLGARSFAHGGLLGTPLEDVLPVELTNRSGSAVRTSMTSSREANKLLLTPEGETHPVMQLAPTSEESRKRWSAAPPLAASATLGGPRPGAQVLAVAAGPDGARPIVAVQRSFRPDQRGMHRLSVEARKGSATLGAVETFMLVGGADQELADPRLNEEVLRRIAAATGGQLVDAAEAGQIAGRLAARATDRAPAIQRDLWHNAWSFLAIVVLLSGEWILRRRWGLR
ncbi:MAG: hypothetical protein LC804_12665 [Acidobacteria bacterium]|nr:hypothetical protein [Acidobacteriota bacterium]